MSTEKITKLTKKEAAKEETLDSSLEMKFAEAFDAPIKYKRIVTIEPFVDPNEKFMGYERYGFSGFPGGSEVQDLAYIEIGYNKKRYLTGLDIQALEIVNMSDPDEKAAIISEIEKTIEWLEDRGYTRDLLKSDNEFFWGQRRHEFENNKRIVTS